MAQNEMYKQTKCNFSTTVSNFTTQSSDSI